MRSDNANMHSDNARTLRSYQNKTQAYLTGTSTAVDGPLQQWIDASLALIPKDSTILEIGSGFGRDAEYIQSRGFDITCSDAVPNFVKLLQEKGLQTKTLNVLTDPIDGVYNMLFADAVLLHFTPEETARVCRKVHAALDSAGIFALRVKKGSGAAWSNEKLDAPRYFCYWQPEPLRMMLADCGFAWVDMIDSHSHRSNADWLGVITRKTA